MIGRGTTPTLTFTLPFNANEMTVYYVTFQQGDSPIFEKNTNDLTMSQKQISLTLTQKETLFLNPKLPLSIQIRCKNASGIAYKSNIMTTNISDALKEGVI